MPAPELASRVRDYLTLHLKGDSVLVLGVSGGPDSQVMMHVVAQAYSKSERRRLIAVGIDHQLRADASKELQLARALAKKLGIAYRETKVTVEGTGNLLANARRARLGALRKVAREHPGARFALGHSQTDQAETVLWNLLRGSHTRGQAGMRPLTKTLIRPLLGADISREEVLAYARAHRISFATDPSNSTPHRMRAIMRQSVFPALAQLRPAPEKNLARFARWAREDCEVLDQLARQQLRKHQDADGLALRAVKRLPPAIQRRVLGLYLKGEGFRPLSNQVESLLALKPGQAYDLHRRRLEYTRNGFLRVMDSAPNHKLRSPVGNVTMFELATAEWQGKTFSGSQVAFDADKLHFPVLLRCYQRGDRIRPWGLGGTKKLSDIFIDKKIPRHQRASWPLVVCGEEILWVVGLCRSAAAPMTKSTRRLLVCEVSSGAPLRGVL